MQIDSIQKNNSVEETKNTDITQLQFSRDEVALLSMLQNELEKVESYEPKTNYLLPENFKVYTNGDVVINHPAAGFEQKTLPILQ